MFDQKKPFLDELVKLSRKLKERHKIESKVNTKIVGNQKEKYKKRVKRFILKS